MTDDTTNSKIDIDAAKIRASIQQYRETDDREEQRETELVYKKLPDDAKEAKRILRSHYVEEL